MRNLGNGGLSTDTVVWNPALGSVAMLKTVLLILLVLIAAFSSSSPSVYAANHGPTVFGPETFVRHIGKPKTEIRAFLADPATQYVMQVKNGYSNGHNRNSSAVIKLNGKSIVVQRDLNQTVDQLSFPVKLKNGNNKLTATLTSKPCSFLTIAIVEASAAGGGIELPPDFVVDCNNGPVADAGPDQTVPRGSTVNLDGSGSTDVDGNGLSYRWAFVSTPTGSTAMLDDVTSVMPSFVVDVPGEYVIQLIVNDGTEDSAPDEVVVSTLNVPPVANAGLNHTIPVGSTAVLFGGASSDVDGDPLTFSWSLVSVPTGSNAVLVSSDTVTTSFVADVAGEYVVELIVNDGFEDSAPDTVVVTTTNTVPIADAGLDQLVEPGDTVTLDGSSSFDVDGDPLSYLWDLISKPPNSTASLSDTMAATAQFVADLHGIYVAQLIVNDGNDDSDPDTSMIVAVAENQAPTAVASASQTNVQPGTQIQLDGSASNDPEDDPLTYLWSLTVPTGSSAALSSTTDESPSFTADIEGSYLVTLVVNDGALDSAPAAVTVSASVGNKPPKLAAIGNRVMFLGGTLNFRLFGLDPDVGDTLTYSLPLMPANMGINGTTGDVSFTPSAAQLGIVNVIGRVDDAAGLFDTQSFTVEVRPSPVTPPSNSAPTLAAIANVTRVVGATLNIQTSAIDPDAGDTLTYTLPLAPAGMSINATGLITFTPIASQVGQHDVTVQVADALGAVALQSFILTVQSLNRAPVAADDAYEGRLGRQVTVDASGVLGNDSDADNDPLSARLTTPPAHGDVILNADGSFTYQSNVLGNQVSQNINLTLDAFPAVRASSIFNGAFAADLTVDGDLNTSWFSARPRSGAEFIEQEWDQDVTAREIQIFGNRSFPNGFDFTDGYFQLFDAAGGILYDSGPVSLPAPVRDLVIDVGEISGVRRMRFTGTATETAGIEGGVAEFYLFGDGLSRRIVVEELWSFTEARGDARDAAGNLVDMSMSSTPVVIDLDGNGVPETVFATPSRHLVALNGDGSVHFIVGGPSDVLRNVEQFSNPAAADIDNDGEPEIVASAGNNNFVRVWEADGAVKWTSAQLPWSTGYGTPAIADLNGDGSPEIVLGAGSANSGVAALAADGTILWTIAGGSGNNGYVGAIPIIADIDLDGVPDVLAGNAVYNADGTIKWYRDDLPDGWNAVGNFDTDPQAEIVLVATSRVYLLEHTGETKLLAPDITTGRGGPPTIADFDSDGAPEIGVAGSGIYIVYDTDLTTLWTAPTADISSSTTGSTVFDFENDGKAEVVYRDEQNLFIYDGATGAERLKIPVRSSTGIEAPVIADIDGNGTADILISSDISIPARARGIYAFSNAGAPWANTRPIWNQHSYHVTNINDDASVPQNEAENWLLYGLNNFRQNVQVGGRAGLVDEFRYVANDGLLDSNEATVTIGLLPPNSAPEILSTPPLTTESGLTYRYAVDAWDVDGDPMTFALSQSPNGMTIDEATGLITWTPNDADIGDHAVTVIVTDDSGFTDLQYWILTVEVSTNEAPTADAGPDQNGITGVQVRLSGAGSTDPDADSLNYAWTLNSPSGSTAALLGAATVNPRFTPDIAGLYTATLVVTDSRASSAPDSVNITVIADADSDNDGYALSAGDCNDADAGINPGANEIPGDGIDQNCDGVDAIHPNDIDDDADGYTENEGDCNDGNAAINPGAADTSNDGIDQNCDGIDGNLALTGIIVSPATSTVLVGQAVSFTATGIFEDGTSQNLTGVASWTNGPAFPSLTAGSFTATASLNGIDGAATINVIDRAMGDTALPLAQITAPSNNSTVTEPVDVIGTASDANFLKYELAYAPAGEISFTTIFTGTAPVTNGVLGQFDPTMLLNDLYTIRLTVFDAGGNQQLVERTVQVDGNMKVGNFTLTFTDLDIPLSGLPITVTRAYDSRVKTSGDFGVGWQLGVKSIRIRSNRVLGTAWEVIRSGLSYGLFPNDAHEISLTLPDGRVEKFDLVVAPSASAIVPFPASRMTARFRPQSGTIGELEALGNNVLSILESQPGTVTLSDDQDLTTYNPRRFRYTAIDGTRIVLSVDDGVESLTDPNGNTLTFTQSGILHSSGRSIVFERDDNNRIVSITDPEGNVQRYAYDGNGDLRAHTDALGNTTKFRYFVGHDLYEIRDPLDRVVSRNEYDSDGRLVRAISEDGREVTFVHNVGNRQEILTDDAGRTTVIDYDDRGNVVRVTDPLGNLTVNSYDSRDNQVSTTNGAGETQTRTFDDDGNVTSMTDPLGNTTTMTYDDTGRVLTRTNALGQTSTLEYDSRGNLVRETDLLGNVTRSTYDASGNRISATDALGRTRTFGFDAFGNQVSATDGRGNTSTFTYDTNGKVVEQVDRLGNTRVRSYDAKGQLTSLGDSLGFEVRYDYASSGVQTGRTDEAGNATSSSVDAAGKELFSTDELGNETRKEYDLSGNLVRITDPAGRQTTLSYDSVDRLIATMAADGATSRLGYDAAGRIVSQTDALDNVTRYEYDAAGRAVKTTDALGNEFTQAYDAVGNVISRTDPLGNVYGFEYDALGRRTTVTFPDGTVERTGFDAVGNVVSETDALGRETRFNYDAENKLVSILDPAGGQTRFEYDAESNLIAQIDANSRRTSYAYDSEGQRISRVRPDGSTATQSFTPTGQLESVTDANGDTITFEYDARDLLIRKIYPDNSQVEFSYTAAGRLQNATDEAGTTSFNYDVTDRLIARINPDGSRIDYQYDAVGNLIAIETLLPGAASPRTVSYSYDALNRLVSVTEGTSVTTYQYDANGNRAQVSYPNDTSVNYSYDSQNRLIMIEHSNNTDVFASFEYVLDASGNRLRILSLDGGSTDYEYDALNRLTRESQVNTSSTLVADVGYTYDAVGNRLQREDRLTSAVITYTYDAADRLLSAGDTTFGYDANGNQVTRDNSGETTAYAFDFENRMIGLAGNGVSTDYEYDFAGDRTGRSDASGSTRFLVSRVNPTGYAQVIEEYRDAGGATASYTFGDALVSQSIASVVSFYHRDGLGSTRLLTDAAGAVTDTYAYDAFGELILRTGTTENRHQFTGERLDANSGFYYLRARYYAAQQGRFTSADPFEGSQRDPVSLHKYLYANANPVLFTDPTGNFSVIELSVSVSIADITLALAPTIAKGTAIIASLKFFVEPGFDLRNAGLAILSGQAFGPRAQQARLELAETAYNLIIAGNTLIQLGSLTIDVASDLIDAGFALGNSANALRSLSRSAGTFSNLAQGAGGSASLIELALKLESVGSNMEKLGNRIEGKSTPSSGEVNATKEQIKTGSLELFKFITGVAAAL